MQWTHLHALRPPRLASIFSMGGHIPYSSTCIRFSAINLVGGRLRHGPCHQAHMCPITDIPAPRYMHRFDLRCSFFSHRLSSACFVCLVRQPVVVLRTFSAAAATTLAASVLFAASNWAIACLMLVGLVAAIVDE